MAGPVTSWLPSPTTQVPSPSVPTSVRFGGSPLRSKSAMDAVQLPLDVLLGPMGGCVVEVEVDMVDLDLGEPHQRDVRPRTAPVGISPHRRPVLVIERLEPRQQRCGTVVDVRNQLRGWPPGAGLDGSSASLTAGIHGGLDARGDPHGEVAERVGVAGEVGQDVPARPVGEQRRAARLVVGQVRDRSLQMCGRLADRIEQGRGAAEAQR